MSYPEIDATGELVCVRSGSNYELMLSSVAPGHAVLIDMPPEVPSWWDGLQWVVKPPQPSRHHEWDAVGKVWRDPRTPEQIRAEAFEMLRLRRNRCLEESDVLALKALEALFPAPLRIYRQALRDLPATTADPDAVQWPDRPF